MDQQQRLLLEKSYEAFHDAGLTKAELLGSGIAANIGCWESEFQFIVMASSASRTVYSATGSQTAGTCGRAAVKRPHLALTAIRHAQGAADE